MAYLCPRGKPPFLTVVRVTGQPHFWSDEKNLSIEEADPAVITNVLMNNWHPDIADYIPGDRRLQQYTQHLERVGDRVVLQEMVVAAVSRNFQFRAESIASAVWSGDLNAL